MYKVQFKARNAYESWTTLGTYGSEGNALDVALKKKQSGALLVRVLDKNGNTVFSA